tara:strand:- start:334711 stop:336684 length:1974 start_codon:yes stop_codon:yes gene_type:complete
MAIAVFQYFYKSKTKAKTMLFLAFLRFLGVFSILLLLINPKIESNVLEIVKPNLVVAIDNSSSIKHLKSETKVLDLVTIIKNDTELSAKFNVSYFSFDEDTKQLDSLEFSTNRTNIRQSLKSFSNLYKENAAMVLITDGNQTVGRDYSYFMSNAQVFPVVVGDTVKHEDLKTTRVNANKYAFLGHNFPVEVFVNYNGINDVNALLTVKKENTTVFKKNVLLDASNTSAQITFNLPATQVGIANYTASLSYLTQEQNKINNRNSFSVEVVNEASKIAIVSAITHPDLGMLKRAIETNKQRQVTIFTPENVPKLSDFQLVVLYQPTTAFDRLFKELNSTSTNRFVITGTQTDWSFLNGIQQDFKKNSIAQTEDYLATTNANYSAFILDELNVEGFPPLQGYFGDITFSTAYETLLFQNIGGFKTETPLLATFTTNDKRGAVLFGENSWKWRAVSFKNSKSFTNFDRFINKLVQYLSIKKMNNRLELDYLPIVYQNDLVKIEATYFDNTFTIDNRASLVLDLVNKETKETKQFPFLLNKDTYEVNLDNLKSADYNFTVRVNNQNTVRSGSFTVLDYNVEQQFTYANTADLKKVASNTGGQLYHISKSQQLLEKIKADNNYKSIQKSTKKSVSLLDWKWLLAMVIFFFSAEWFIRKYRGLI